MHRVSDLTCVGNLTTDSLPDWRQITGAGQKLLTLKTDLLKISIRLKI